MSNFSFLEFPVSNIVLLLPMREAEKYIATMKFRFLTPLAQMVPALRFMIPIITMAITILAAAASILSHGQRLPPQLIISAFQTEVVQVLSM